MWLYFLVCIRLFVLEIIFKLVTLCLCKEQLAIILYDHVFIIGYQLVTCTMLYYRASKSVILLGE